MYKFWPRILDTGEQAPTVLSPPFLMRPHYHIKPKKKVFSKKPNLPKIALHFLLRFLSFKFHVMEKGWIRLFNTSIFCELHECNLGMATFIAPLQIIQALFKYGDGDFIRSIRQRWKNIKTIFFILLFCCCSCVFLSFLFLYQQAQGVVCDCKFFVLHLCCHHLHVFYLLLKPPLLAILSLYFPVISLFHYDAIFNSKNQIIEKEEAIV